MAGYGQEIDRIKSGKEQSSSDTGSEKGWPKYGNYALNDGYVGAFRLHRRISCGFHVVRPPARPYWIAHGSVVNWRTPVAFKTPSEYKYFEGRVQVRCARQALFAGFCQSPGVSRAWNGPPSVVIRARICHDASPLRR